MNKEIFSGEGLPENDVKEQLKMDEKTKKHKSMIDMWEALKKGGNTEKADKAGSVLGEKALNLNNDKKKEKHHHGDSDIKEVE